MIEVAIMVEGQNGLNWPRWQRLAAAVEDLGFTGLYRSDHFTNMNPPDLDSLELWISLAWLATHTKRIEFGPLVTPLSFRHPVHTARMASAVDDLSGGRLILGVGAGWQEREHSKFGLDLLDLSSRFDRFTEGVDVITRLLRSDEPVDFEGKYYRLDGAILLPRPSRPGGPPLLIGGKGKNRTLPLVVTYASEWNAAFINPGEFKRINSNLDELLTDQGKQPGHVRRSLMTGCIFGTDEADLQRRVTARGRTLEELIDRGVIAGTASQIVEQLDRLSEAGVQRIMLQWLELDDIDGLEAMAGGILR